MGQAISRAVADYNADTGSNLTEDEWIATEREVEQDLFWPLEGQPEPKSSLRALARRYGADPDEYRRARESSVCPACLREIKATSRQKRGLQLHHDHATNRFVAFLCWRCNLALGLMDDSVGLIRTLADYIEVRIELRELEGRSA